MGLDAPYAVNQSDNALNRRFKAPDVLPSRGGNPAQSINLHGVQPAARAQVAGGVNFNPANGVQGSGNVHFNQANSRPPMNQLPVNPNARQMLKVALINKYKILNNELLTAKSQNGFIGQGWDWFKNKTGLFTGSNKVQDEINNIRKQLAELDRNPQSCNGIYRNLTGKDLNPNELRNLSHGIINLKAEQAIGRYKQGQEMAVEAVADLAAGIAGFAIYPIAIAAAPFTGGASIAVGLAAAGAVGAAVKVGVKALDAYSGGRSYTTLKRDLITGAIGGVLAPISGGVGGACGKAVAERLGIEYTARAGAEVAEQGLIKSILLNPKGYQYAGNAIRPFLAEMEVAGITYGTLYNSSRAAVDGDDIASAAGYGFIGGALGGLVLGGLGVAAGKLIPIVGNQLSSLTQKIEFTGGKLGSLLIGEKAVNGEIIQAYTRNLLEYEEVHGSKVLFKPGSRVSGTSPTILFNGNKSFNSSLDILEELSRRYNQDIQNGVPVDFQNIRTSEFDVFRRAMDLGQIPKFKIRGMIGQGKDSIALLTSDNQIIKLSTKPNFPAKEIEGIDVPIHGKYIIQNVDGRGTNVYAVLEDFTESLSLREVSYDEMDAIEEQINEQLARINPNYHLVDVGPEQFGMDKNGKIYLIDHQCIGCRKLVGEK